MTNKCLDGGQWPLDTQAFDYERMFGCFPDRTDFFKNRAKLFPIFHLYSMRETKCGLRQG
jgi:hypothetical protein